MRRGMTVHLLFRPFMQFIALGYLRYKLRVTNLSGMIGMCWHAALCIFIQTYFSNC